MTIQQLTSLPVDELITRYKVYKRFDGKIGFQAEKSEANAVVEIMGKRKPEILAYFEAIEAEEKRKAEEHQRKIDAIPGLRELDTAYDDLASWQAEFNASFEGEGGGGVGVRPRPVYDLDALSAKYPSAVAYRKARHEALKENYEIAAYGKEAMRMIEDDPSNYQAALDYMEAERKAFVNRHIWD